MLGYSSVFIIFLSSILLTKPSLSINENRIVNVQSSFLDVAPSDDGGRHVDSEQKTVSIKKHDQEGTDKADETHETASHTTESVAHGHDEHDDYDDDHENHHEHEDDHKHDTKKDTAESSSNYLSLKGKDAPGDRGEGEKEGDKTSGGKPAADVSEDKGEVNKEADGRTSSGESDRTSDNTDGEDKGGKDEKNSDDKDNSSGDGKDDNEEGKDKKPEADLTEAKGKVNKEATTASGNDSTTSGETDDKTASSSDDKGETKDDANKDSPTSGAASPDRNDKDKDEEKGKGEENNSKDDDNNVKTDDKKQENHKEPEKVDNSEDGDRKDKHKLEEGQKTSEEEQLDSAKTDADVHQHETLKEPIANTEDDKVESKTSEEEQASSSEKKNVDGPLKGGPKSLNLTCPIDCDASCENFLGGKTQCINNGDKEKTCSVFSDVNNFDCREGYFPCAAPDVTAVHIHLMKVNSDGHGVGDIELEGKNFNQCIGLMVVKGGNKCSKDTLKDDLTFTASVLDPEYTVEATESKLVFKNVHIVKPDDYTVCIYQQYDPSKSQSSISRVICTMLAFLHLCKVDESIKTLYVYDIGELKITKA